MGTKAVAAQAWLGESSKAIRRRAQRFALLPAVASALAAGVLVACVAYQVVFRYTPTSDAKAAPIDITKVALTIVAGVGGVVALVIAYRRQRDAEQSRFVERFGAAAAQLGATDVAVRIAGVYAMAGAADESDGLHRQQCIDVLCGYLRLPYTPDIGSNHQAKAIHKFGSEPSANPPIMESEKHFEYRQNDSEVRKTIVRVIAEHLRSKAEYSWSASDFDFRTAHLEDVDLNRTTFSGAARFDGAKFTGAANFYGATFTSAAMFDAATFTGAARFDAATFTSDAMFDAATFTSDAMFDAATFTRDASFDEATFTRDASFDEATFTRNAGFSEATFTGAAMFSRAMFTRDAMFTEAKFTGYLGWFDGATFTGDAMFVGATFAGDARFVGATFTRDARFDEATFTRDAMFTEAKFTRDAQFDGATFTHDASFDGATFTGDASFVAADFGTGRINFNAPKQWGPPPPKFDWNNDGIGKPSNIEPQNWPPATAASETAA